MSLHIRDFRRRHTTTGKGLRVQLALGRGIWNGDGGAVGALVHCGTENGAQDGVPVGQRLREGLENENSGAFAAAISISLGIKGSRGAGGAQKRSRRQVLVEAGAGDQVDTSGNGDGAFLCLKGLFDCISSSFRKPCLTR